jgi:hypothetical protein
MKNRNKPARLSYQEGDWFIVPFPDHLIVALVARLDGRGTVLGYFFERQQNGVSDATRRLCNLEKSDAILAKMFGDLDL